MSVGSKKAFSNKATTDEKIPPPRSKTTILADATRKVKAQQKKVQKATEVFKSSAEVQQKASHSLAAAQENLNQAQCELASMRANIGVSAISGRNGQNSNQVDLLASILKGNFDVHHLRGQDNQLLLKLKDVLKEVIDATDYLAEAIPPQPPQAHVDADEVTDGEMEINQDVAQGQYGQRSH